MNNIEVVIWDTSGFWNSSFGHVSVNIEEGGTKMSYSLTAERCEVVPFQRYLVDKRGTNGYGLVLKLNGGQKDRVREYFKKNFINGSKTGATCGFVGFSLDVSKINNCTSNIQKALKEAGIVLGGPGLIQPRALGLQLWNRGFVKQVNKYKSSLKVDSFRAPWMNTQQGAYPWER